MTNIGAFIAWGFITALFIPTGWWPNASLGQLVEPMLRYLLPLLIAMTAGRHVAGDRGGVIAAVAVMGVILGSDIPMFIGAMAIGPFAGWVIRSFDRWAEGRIPAGFEMLVNNFSVGILGIVCALIGFYAVGPVVSALTVFLSAGVSLMIEHGLLPLVAVFIEPAKVLFLNNAINHGIFSPIGIEQARQTGQSIMFLLETNPGPGLGVLLAYWAFARGAARSSAPGAIVIQFFGGDPLLFAYRNGTDRRRVARQHHRRGGDGTEGGDAAGARRGGGRGSRVVLRCGADRQTCAFGGGEARSEA